MMMLTVLIFHKVIKAQNESLSSDLLGEIQNMQYYQVNIDK